MTVDLADGGRWTSLHLGGREWLWAGPGLVPGPRTGWTSFVDAGGLDECYPTVRGTPDHGGLWNQPWTVEGDWQVATYDGTRLLRRFSGSGAAVRADYRLEGPPGYRFVWAAHALLDCAVGASVVAPNGTACRLYAEEGPWVEAAWPAGLETYGPTDGTALGAVLVDCPTTSVRDGADELTFEISCPGQPVSTALWRNLGGFPAGAPYRSLGVEPMLGRVFGLAEAGPDDAAVIPPSGVLSWRLTAVARSR